MAVIGNSTIFPIELAASIANTARSVGIVRLPSGPESEGLAVGTGFLVDKDLVVTASHVVMDYVSGSFVRSNDLFTVDFDYVAKESGGTDSVSFVDATPYPWVDAAAGEMHSLLADAYSESDRRFGVLMLAGIPRQSLLQEGTPNATWRQALDVAASMGRTRTLIDTVLEDQSVSGFHPRIRALLPSAAPIAAHVVAATVEPTGWAALRLEEPSSRPPLALAAATTAAPGDGVIIVQHAAGGRKQFVLEPAGIVGVGHLALAGVDPDSPLSRLAAGVTDDELVYVADTEPGSSGAPVFDMRLRVIGMHLRGSIEAQVNVGLGVEAIRRGLEEHGISFVEAAPPT